MNPPHTAPKDDTFLADVGLPYLVVCMWCGAETQWVYADIQCDMYNGKWNDMYFQNEHINEDELEGWLPIPEV